MKNSSEYASNPDTRLTCRTLGVDARKRGVLDALAFKWSITAVKHSTIVGILVGAFLAQPLAGHAQPVEVRNDNIRVDSEAALSCGFCAGEKFGALFYDPILPTSSFPLSLTKVKLALASITVVEAGGGFRCEPGAGGMLNVNYEVYTGSSVPASITSLPSNGVWPGESVVVPITSAPITLSEPSTPGSTNYRLNLNEIPLNGITIAPPNAYIRVVVTIPTGSVQSASCQALGLQPPAAVAFRDIDITGTSRRNFIYQIDPIGIVGNRWVFNEAFQDPVSGNNINGDWIIRLEVEAMSSGTPRDGGISINPDAAPPTPADSGPQAPADTGVQVPSDSGVSVAADTGPVNLGPPSITAITPTEGSNTANTPVVIIGSGFADGASVRIGQIPLIGIEVPGSTTIKGVVPAGIAVGVYDVLVENSDSQIALLPKGFAVTDSNGGSGNTGAPPAASSCGCQTQGPASQSAHLFMVFALVGLGLGRRRSKR
jgi:MYXO-CTERM domain-containing protein